MEFEGVLPLECSPPARRRRAALEDGGTDERSRSEGTLSENAWPRAQLADGGRAHIGHGRGLGNRSGGGSG